jgi:predicted RNase H-like HicB family nuclease
MRDYIALIHKDEGSDFGVSFPDFPGCVTAGSTLDEARALAVEALAFHIEGMIEERLDIPDPSTLEAVMKRRANREGVVVLVSPPQQAVKTERVNITVPEATLRAIDQYAKKHGFSRSAFLVNAAKRVMQDA